MRGFFFGLGGTSLKHKQITLIRHGALESDLDGCYVGHLDVPLSNEGQSQARKLAERLTDQNIDCLWCSPALRAQQTVAPITEQLIRPCTIKAQLNEVNFGRWEGLTFKQICASDPDLVDQWAKYSDDFCFPDGESQHHFQQRVTEIAQQIHNNSGHLALVTHGGVIRALLCQLLGFTNQDYLKFEINRGSFVTLTIRDQHAVLTGLYND
ncbi:MAG: alpha-ribazole phosphatase [Desulfobacteraceae bacterium 4572_35.2]|nr:MAG: alpha-ribazole phosphatase [Desulfobacteraceae bacterium 4572_35.2]